MKYVIQIMAMIGDLAFATAMTTVIVCDPHNPLIWFVVPMAFMSWDGAGGPIAWTKSGIRRFFKGAKKYGL